MQQPTKPTLSDSQIYIILALIVSLFILAFYRLTQLRVFDVNNIAADQHNGFCRVSFNAANRKQSSVSGKAIIQIYEDDGKNSEWPNIYLAISASVPVSLLSGQTKMVRVDVAHSGRCKKEYVEITALGSQG